MNLNQSREEILSHLTSGVEQLETALQGLSEASLDLAEAPGEWTIRKIVHHLADDDDFWSMPLKKAIATPGAPIRLETFPGNKPREEALAFDNRRIAESLALIKTHRLAMAELTGFFIADWESCYIVLVDRPGKPDKVLTLEWVIGILSEHLNEHLMTIEDIKRKNGL